MDNQNNEEIVDLEHVILRLPDHIANELNKDLARGCSLQDRLLVRFNSDPRDCTIRYNGRKIKGKLVDLPNEACTMKTVDNELFTNLLTIKHMIVCQENTYNNKQPSYNKDFVYKHGVTAPLKNINIARYRKPRKKQNLEIMNLIKEMLIEDSKAESVWYTMEDEGDDKEKEKRDMEYILKQCALMEEQKRERQENKGKINAQDENDDDSSDDDNNDDSDSDDDSSDDDSYSSDESDDSKVAAGAVNDDQSDDSMTDNEEFEEF